MMERLILPTHGQVGYRELALESLEAPGSSVVLGLAPAHGTVADRSNSWSVRWLGFTPVELTFTATQRRVEQTKCPLLRQPRRAAYTVMTFSPSFPRLALLAGLAATGVSGLACITAVALLMPLSDPVARVGLVLLTALHLLAAGGLVIAGVLCEYAVRTCELAKGHPGYVVKVSTAEADPWVARLRRTT